MQASKLSQHLSLALGLLALAAPGTCLHAHDHRATEEANSELPTPSVQARRSAARSRLIEIEPTASKSVARLPIITTARPSTFGGEQPVRVGRYSALVPAATRAQRKLLDRVISIQFPPDIQTVGEAIRRLLQGSGFELAQGLGADPELTTLLRLPLPDAHRQLGPITLRHALKALAGPAWMLVVDPLHRKVGFDVTQTYQPQARVIKWTY